MTQDEHIQYWLTSAQHDLESADSIFTTGKYDWCLFVGNLALEKMLKALFVAKNNNALPPKIHNLVRLAELSGLTLTTEQKFTLDKINDFNLQTRYPDYKLEFYKQADKSFATEYLNKIKEFYTWFNSQLK